MRKRRHVLQVSTFPFLAVLLCAMGSLILLLLVIDRRAKIVARARAIQALMKVEEEETRRADAEARRLEENTSRAAEDARRAAAAADRRRDEWERRRQALHASLAQQDDELQTQIREAHRKIDAAGEQINGAGGRWRDLQDQLRTATLRVEQAHQDLALRRAALAQDEKLSEASRAELARLAKNLEQLEQTLAELKAARKREQKTYSLVPYAGKRGDNRRPIYVECNARGLIFHPDRLELPEYRTSATTIRSEVERRVAVLARLPGGDAGKNPYLLMLVRPDGIMSYYRALAALNGMKIDLGYEFIEPEWVLDFPADEDRPGKQPWMTTGRPAGTQAATTASAGSPQPAHTLRPGRLQGVRFGAGGPEGGDSLTGSVPNGTSAGTIGFAPFGSEGGAPGAGPPASGVFVGPSAGGADLSRGVKLGDPSGFGGAGGGAGGGSGTSAFPGPFAAGGSEGSGPYAENSPGRGEPGSRTGQTGSGPARGQPGGGSAGRGAGQPGGGTTDGTLGDGGPNGTGDSSSLQGKPETFGSAAQGGTGSSAGQGYPGKIGVGPAFGSALNPGESAGGQPGRLDFGGGDQGGLASAAGQNGGPSAAGGSGGGGSSSGDSSGQGSSAGGSPGTTGQPNPGQAGPPGQPGSTIAPPGLAPNLGSPSAQPGTSMQSGHGGATEPGTSGSSLESSGTPAGAAPSHSQGDGDEGGSPAGGTAMSRVPVTGIPVERPAQNRTARPASRPAWVGRNRDWVIPIECTPDAIVIHPSRVLIATDAVASAGDPNPLQQTLRQMIDRRQATVPPGDPPFRPMVRFLVRPGGLRSYYLAWPALEPLHVPMTRENLDKDEQIDTQHFLR